MSPVRNRQAPSAPRQIGANDNRALAANDHAAPRAVVILLGSLPVISRRPIDELTPGEQARIGRIEAAQRGRKHREAAKLALEFEASLGITPDDRIAALAPANDIDRMVELALGYAVTAYAEDYTPPPPPKREKKLKGKRKPKVKKVDALADFPVGDLRQDEIDAVEAAEIKLRSPDLEVKKAGAETMSRIRRAVAKRVAEKAVSDGLAETKALEALRGKRVEKSKDPRHMGGFEVPGRDGMETLSETKTAADGTIIPGTLTGIQYSAGLRYRKDYEIADPERLLTPPTLLREGRAKGGGGEGYDAKVAESWDRIRTTHFMIAGLSADRAGHSGRGEHDRPSMPALPADHPARRAIFALTEIAGKGSNPSELTNSGGTRGRLVDALKAALDVAAIVYGLE